MIKDIVNILHKMELACPVECVTSLKADLRGNLIMVWLWNGEIKSMKYSRLIAPEYDDVAIELTIEQAKVAIENYNG